jgi:hypothetical protein
MGENRSHSTVSTVSRVSDNGHGGGLITCLREARSVVEGGVLFDKAPGIDSLYDSWFNARVCARGATLAYNLPLVEWHQGQHETTTSAITDDQLTEEFLAF